MRWLAVVALVVTVLVSALGSFRDFRDSREIDNLAALTTKAGATGGDPVLHNLTGQVMTWQIGGALFALGALAAATAIVMVVRRRNVIPAVALLVVAVVVATLVSPGETNLWEGAAVRTIGYVAIGAAVIAGALALVASRRPAAVPAPATV